jgi:hypothetical protein
MPHHSGQQQQQQQPLANGFPGVSMMRVNPTMPYRQMDFRPDFRSGIMPIHMQQHMALMGGWVAGIPETPGGPPILHRAPIGISIDDSTYPSTSNRSTGTPKSIPRNQAKTFDSPQDVANSALFLAAGDSRKRNKQPSIDELSEASGPLKKRKKVMDIMRHKTKHFYVSPMSQGSKEGQPLTSNSSTSSYDLKDGECLPEAAKIKDAGEITPPAKVVIPKFPSLLHHILTKSDFAGKVGQWLPHGKAWRIVRWDALRKQVLPKYFPQLLEDDGKRAMGSIDAFLWHLAAWGFEEITEGPDVGAYSNVVR